MSVATYTDGSYTIYGICRNCGTVCTCGAVKHHPAEKPKSIYEILYKILKEANK